MTSAQESPRRLNIGMIDADLLDNGTRHPNLAQMKMSAYCKSRGHNVHLLHTDEDLKNYQQLDLVIVSKVFNFSNNPKYIDRILPKDPNFLREYNGCIKDALDVLENSSQENVKILIGGTGYFKDGGRDLHHDIEHIMPDYHLYDEYIALKESLGCEKSYYDDYKYYSIGFTTRGCFRKCPFCVNQKYNKAQKHSPVSEFLDESRPGIYLWDDNLFALFNGWDEILDELIATNKTFQFRQGLDIRLLTEKHAKKLSECKKFHGDFIFAFDDPKNKDLIERKLTLWRKFCNKTTKLYVLCAFDAQNEAKQLDAQGIDYNFDELELKDVEGLFERIKILMKYGCLPYVMRFEFYKKSKFRNMYTQVARWCNQPQFFKKKSFREFCVANQYYHKNKDTLCSAYRTLLDFEKEYPDIANKYFDLKFEYENLYHPLSNYSRKDSTPCALCKEWTKITFDDVIRGSVEPQLIVRAYILDDLDFLCLKNEARIDCVCNLSKAPELIIKHLLNTPVSTILDYVDESDPSILISEIPQFSSLQKTYTEVLKAIENNNLSFMELGTIIDNGNFKSDAAKVKYGENHGKLAASLDLAFISKHERVLKVEISPIGKIVLNMDPADVEKLIIRLIMRIPIIQFLLKEAKDRTVVYLEEEMANFLPKKSTLGRRKSSILSLLKYLKKSDDKDVYIRVEKII